MKKVFRICYTKEKKMKTKQQKILYIDVPFLGLCGGDKNRSKFLFDTLCKKYDTDILLIQNKTYEKSLINNHKVNKLFTIKSKKSAFYLPQSLYDFDKKTMNYFKKILKDNQYDILMFKFSSTAILANWAKKILPFSNIIIDVDMLSSRICYETWKNNKTLKNRYYLIEYLKLYNFEKSFLKNDFTFFYTNDKEINLVKKQYHLKNINNHQVLPNIFKETKKPFQGNQKGRFILFYGMLNSTVNETAYSFLIKSIYPLIKQTLIEEDIKILIIGKNQTPIYQQTHANIEVIGEVDNLDFYINACEFVFLPLKIASGTLTRILEVAFFKKAVLTTSIGVEGLNMHNCIFVEDEITKIASQLSVLIKNKYICEETGSKAFSYVTQHHSEKEVSNRFYTFIDQLKIKKIHVIHIPRRFTTTHWGGTENVVLSYAKGLKKFNIESKIYTTKILNTKKNETIKGIQVKRFSYFYPYVNLNKQQKEKLDYIGGNIFSFTLLWTLLFQKNLDLVHLHTFKRLGGIARFICKIRNIPYLVSIHGGVYNRVTNESERDLSSSNKSFEWGKILGLIVGSRRVIQDADAVICLNNQEYKSINEKSKSKNIFLIPNSVDTSFFSHPKKNNLREVYQINKNKFICLVSGRIDKQKNQLLLLEALKNLKLELNNLHIMLVGNITDDYYYSQLKHYITKHSLQNHVTIITDIQPESSQLLDFYLNANALILPSIHEPFGIVVLEAWASGLPVIVSEVAGICDMIENEKDALIFKSNNLESLQKNIKQLVLNTPLQKVLIQNSKTKVLQFDTNNVNSQINSIYRQLLNRH